MKKMKKMKSVKRIKFSDIKGMLEKDEMREIIGDYGNGGNPSLNSSSSFETSPTETNVDGLEDKQSK